MQQSNLYSLIALHGLMVKFQIFFFLTKKAALFIKQSIFF